MLSYKTDSYNIKKIKIYSRILIFAKAIFKVFKRINMTISLYSKIIKYQNYYNKYKTAFKS